jgi:hypothetical protein
MASLGVAAITRAVRSYVQSYVQFLLRLPIMVRKVVYNRTAAVVVGSLLYTLRGTLWVALLRGKWVGWAWNRLQRRRQLRNFEESNFDNRAQAALYIPKQCANGSPHRVAKRTLFEESLVNLLYGNTPAASVMRRATRRCTQAKPFLTQHVEKNAAHPLLNAVLNRLSSLAAVQHIKAESVVGEEEEEGEEMGAGAAGIEPVWFVFAVIGYSPSEGFRAASGETVSFGGINNHEGSGVRLPKTAAVIDRRSSKVRVVVVREDRLRSLNEISHGDQQSEPTQAHSERHAFRSNILLHMKALYNEQLMNEDGTAPRHLLRVQMGYRRVGTLQPRSNKNPRIALLQSPHLRGAPKGHNPLSAKMAKNEDGNTPKMFTPRR